MGLARGEKPRNFARLIQGGVLEVENPDLESFFGGVDHGFLLLMSLE